MEAYAIYSSLRSQLNSNSAALKEVQTTKTGFALCPSSPEALLALEAQKEIISAFFVNCQIERSSQWVSYRVTNVPRKIGQILNGQYSLIPVNPTLLSSEISETTGLKPTSISETTSSAVNPDTPSSSWFMNFPEGMKTPLPIQLHLFGTITNAHPVPAPLDAGYVAPQSILKRAMPIAAQPWNLINALLDAYTVMDHIQLISQNASYALEAILNILKLNKQRSANPAPQTSQKLKLKKDVALSSL
ncbi:hypothetical protein TSTA_052350 [Talaromyces stipitatus ATCC 10500]|uniref:Uncharacterized protein n=1 Tax=Talaromyces stipitatus (strain ATCC 10500 / CBS 375.48 / QM 6759 / NRRL 1006) TaxID=441959 RepID=B8MQR5_TALSN|nr:uncharacterized protein TSTA_052350 [Talaromyces stipitatus ATCC 10500]EED12712.1 hypothetical protein TSTA_052350 [Talaromyces stipitatus ATCC 10500]